MRPNPSVPTLGSGTRVLVVGLGLHGGGVATVRYLAGKGCRVRVTDQRSAVQLAPSLARLRHTRFTRVLGRHRIADVRWADVVVQNPAVPRTHPLITAARRRGTPVVNDAALYLSAAPGPVVAVTGTRGKSTTVALTSLMLGVPRAGLPGEPMLGLLSKLRPNQSSVVELSSWQCELVPKARTAPDVAVITNLSRDHMNRYRNVRSYAEAKAGLLRYQTLGLSGAVLNRDDPVVRRFGPRVRGHRAWFALKFFAAEDGTFANRGWLWVRDAGREHRVAPRSVLQLPGDHMTANALAALAAAWWLDADPERIRRALVRFQGLPGRQQRVRERRGVAFVNDTTATSPAGTLAALSAWSAHRPVLIAGGVDKRLEFRALAAAIERTCTAVVLLPGSASDRLLRLLPPRVSVVRAATMGEAVEVAAGLAPSGSAVLLSPGAASFNLFRHEYDRGTAFEVAVRRLS